MSKTLKNEIIHADGIDIGIYTSDYENEYISLTDIAKRREGEYPGYVIQNWMRNRSTVSFIGLWELLHNPEFNCLEFEAIKKESGDNGFVMTHKPNMYRNIVLIDDSKTIPKYSFIWRKFFYNCC